MGNCSSTSNCNPCGPDYSAINQLATKAGAYARQANTYATNAENAWLEFNALYLGAFAVAPTEDNEGDPLQVGALYWNTAANELYVWDGINWVQTNDFDEFTPFLATGTTTARNLATRFSEFVNVKDFGAVGDGTTNDSPAFLAAYNACPFGGTVKVPQTGANGYLLNTNPDTNTKPVIWDFDMAIQLKGAGLGNPNVGAGLFASPATNPWLRIAGKQEKQFLGGIVSPAGGAVAGQSIELRSDALSGWPKTISGTITNGSSLMTSVSNTTGIEPGYGIIAITPIGGWPSGATKANTMRVVSVDHVNQTITFGPDSGNGSGYAVATNWTGATTPSATFQIRKRHWMVAQYSGAETGPTDNIDVYYQLWNPVLNITGTAGAVSEFNLNSYAITSDFCRALFITGGGGTQNNKLVGIDIQRGETVQWLTGVSVRNAKTGIYTNAKTPIEIDTTYNNNQTGLTETVACGIRFLNEPALVGALLEGRQLTNGSNAIQLWRQTDAAPTGKFLNFKNAANSNDLFFVGINGEISTLAPSSSNGSTISAGSIECNGITLRGTTNLRFGVDPTLVVTAVKGYIEAYDSSNNLVKLAVLT
jgi:hypothetical protein